MKPFSRIMARIYRICVFVSSGCVFVMMLWGVVSILALAILNYQVPALYEVSSLLLVIAVYLGVPFTQFEGGNIRIDIVIRRLRGSKRAVTEVLSNLISLATTMLILWRVGDEAFISLKGSEFQPGMFTFPIWPSKAVVALGFLFLCICIMIQIWWRLQSFKSLDTYDQRLRDALKA